MDIKEFLKQPEIQELLENNDLDEIYERFDPPFQLTKFLVAKNIDPIKYVTKIHATMYWMTDITDIIIPDSITAIEAAAFTGCRRLGTVNIPSSVKFIANNAFDFMLPPTIICDSGSCAHKYAIENNIPVKLLNESLNESLEEEKDTLIEDITDNANEEKRIIDDIRKLFTEQDFEEEEKLNGIAFTQELNKPLKLLAQFYIDTTDLTHECYIKSEDSSLDSNYSNKGNIDSLQKSAALFIKEFINITTADII